LRNVRTRTLAPDPPAGGGVHLGHGAASRHPRNPAHPRPLRARFGGRTRRTEIRGRHLSGRLADRAARRQRPHGLAVPLAQHVVQIAARGREACLDHGAARRERRDRTPLADCYTVS